MRRTKTTDLPPPRQASRASLEEALAERRSVREFKEQPLSLEELSQLLWAAQGVTAPDGGRAAPSAGATYPLEIYAVVGRVKGLGAGVYHYVPAGHRIRLVAERDHRKALARAALDQDWMAEAPICIALAAVERRTARRYGERAALYVHFEAGCASENAALQAEALGLGTCVVGAFADDGVARILGLGRGEQPLALMPFGRKPKAGEAGR
jgi:SagB-type dehydrogenase family enzyme